MKLVIDIPDDNYKFIKDLQSLIIGGRGNCKTIQYNVINAIKNGTPYEERPKGKWELYQYQESRKKDWYCTACATIVKKPLEKKYIFCPYCGADNRGGV